MKKIFHLNIDKVVDILTVVSLFVLAFCAGMAIMHQWDLRHIPESDATSIVCSGYAEIQGQDTPCIYCIDENNY